MRAASFALVPADVISLLSLLCLFLSSYWCPHTLSLSLSLPLPPPLVSSGGSSLHPEAGAAEYAPVLKPFLCDDWENLESSRFVVELRQIPPVSSASLIPVFLLFSLCFSQDKSVKLSGVSRLSLKELEMSVCFCLALKQLYSNSSWPGE